MSLPEIEMPEPVPDPPPLPSDVRSESVNYDDAEPAEQVAPRLKTQPLINALLEQAEQASEAQKESMPVPQDGVVEGSAGGVDDLRIKPVIDDTDIFKDAKPKKKRKPPSEKQLAHLAKAREKAAAVRIAKTAAKKQAKKKVAFDDVLQKTDPRPRREGPAHESLLLHMTRAELVELQQNAIEGYDTKRKAQKKVKRDAAEEVRKANLVNQRIGKAVGHLTPDDQFGQCFSFT